MQELFLKLYPLAISGLAFVAYSHPQRFVQNMAPVLIVLCIVAFVLVLTIYLHKCSVELHELSRLSARSASTRSRQAEVVERLKGAYEDVLRRLGVVVLLALVVLALTALPTLLELR